MQKQNNSKKKIKKKTKIKKKNAYIYCPNIFLVMERSEFPLSSVCAVGPSLQFLVLVLSLLGAVMLGCVAVYGAPACLTDLRGIHSG
jgi:hypothetical protein